MRLCFIWLLHFLPSSETSSDGSVVWRVSVPEHHVLCLPCGPGLDLNQDFNWTHGVQEVPHHHRDEDQDQDPDQDQDQDQDQWRFSVRPNGTLCILSLQRSDCGLYFCNGELRAELQVLSGLLFSVPVGWTLLLPCSSSSRPRQRWFWRKSGSRSEYGSRSRWEPVLSRSRAGSVVRERPDPRLGFEHGALRILSLRLHDAGEYRCNADSLGTLQVLDPKPTFDPRHSPVTSVTSAPDFVEKKAKEKKSENVLLVVVLVLALMVLGTFSVCVFLLSLKCRRKRRQRKAKQSLESTELQPWTTALKPDDSGPEEGIHYASLGRPTWKHRPALTNGSSDEHRVIYSTVRAT